MAKINVDEDHDNADWSKRNAEFPKTLEEFRIHLASIEIIPVVFKTLPIYRFNVAAFPTCAIYKEPFAGACHPPLLFPTRVTIKKKEGRFTPPWTHQKAS